MIVECKACGSKYEMPDIGKKVVMNDCPTCREAKDMVDEFLKELGLNRSSNQTAKEKK